ncbi:MAG TPA: hypothetical protein VFP61_05540 [Acidimicrobiales bacterium]|nr:hypothetical protein [Acidimicrobiales bacterium]
MACGIDAAAAVLGQARPELARRRLEVIAANRELREREAAKLADYAAAVAEALRRRGVADPAAALAADAGMSVLRVAMARWAAGDRRPLGAVAGEVMAEFGAVAAGAPLQRPASVPAHAETEGTQP